MMKSLILLSLAFALNTPQVFACTASVTKNSSTQVINLTETNPDGEWSYAALFGGRIKLSGDVYDGNLGSIASIEDTQNQESVMGENNDCRSQITLHYTYKDGSDSVRIEFSCPQVCSGG